MIRILDSKELEKCVSSVASVEVLLDGKVDESTMHLLAKGAKLSFYPDFPKPLFKIEKTGAYHVVGLLGNCSIRVTCLQPGRQVIQALRQCLQQSVCAEDASHD